MAPDKMPVIGIIHFLKESRLHSETQSFAHLATNIAKWARVQFMSTRAPALIQNLNKARDVNIKRYVVVVEGYSGISGIQMVLWSGLLNFVNRGGTLILVTLVRGPPCFPPHTDWIKDALLHLPVPWTLSSAVQKQHFQRNDDAAMLRIPTNIEPTFFHPAFHMQNVCVDDAWYVPEGTKTQDPAWERDSRRIAGRFPSARIPVDKRLKYGPKPPEYIEDDDLPDAPTRQHPYGASSLRLTPLQRALGVESRGEHCGQTLENEDNCGQTLEKKDTGLNSHRRTTANLGPAYWEARLQAAEERMRALEQQIQQQTQRLQSAVSPVAAERGRDRTARAPSPDYRPRPSSNNGPSGPERFLRTPSTPNSGSRSSIHTPALSSLQSDNHESDKDAESDMPDFPQPQSPNSTAQQNDILLRAGFGRQRATQQQAEVPAAPRPPPAALLLPQPVQDPHLQAILKRAGFGSKTKAATRQAPPIPPRPKPRKKSIPTGPGWRESSRIIHKEPPNLGYDGQPVRPVKLPEVPKVPEPLYIPQSQLPPWRLPDDHVHNASRLYEAMAPPATRPRERESAPSTAQVTPAESSASDDQGKDLDDWVRDNQASEPPPKVETPVALTRVGKGAIGFVGQYFASPENDRLLLELCRRGLGEVD